MKTQLRKQVDKEIKGQIKLLEASNWQLLSTLVKSLFGRLWRLCVRHKAFILGLAVGFLGGVVL